MLLFLFFERSCCAIYLQLTFGPGLISPVMLCQMHTWNPPESAWRFKYAMCKSASGVYYNDYPIAGHMGAEQEACS